MAGTEPVHGAAMKRSRNSFLIAVAVLILSASLGYADQPSPAAVAGFNAYVNGVEARMARQHSATGSFVVLDAIGRTRARCGEILVEPLTPPNQADLPGAMLHHWRASGFVPGATAENFDRLLRNYSGYPTVFSPQVVQAQVLARQGDDLQVALRLRQHHVLTVVLDTEYDVRFSELDARHIASFSRSTRIAEVAAPGTRSERSLGPAEDHGYLWRLDTWWSAEQADGGVYLQVESISLTRSIPTGLAWLVRPYIESVPRESLEFTLRAVCRALRR